MPGNFVGAHQGCQVAFRPPIPNVGLVLRRCSGKGLHLAMTGERRGFSRVSAGFSSYDGEFRMPLVPSGDLRDTIPFIFITDEPVARGYGDGYMVEYVILDRSPKK